MSPEELNNRFQENKDIFHNYINNIKKKSKWDIYNIINPTLVKNPYASVFPRNFFRKDTSPQSFSKLLFLRVILQYYLKNLYLYISYIIAFMLYKFYYKKERKRDVTTLVDVFGLVDATVKNNVFSENYLTDIYEIFDKNNVNYTMLLRPYGIGKNPFKLKEFFQIINRDKREFIFEYELLSFKNFLELAILIMLYPFKVLRLLQDGDDEIKRVFNYSLILDINHFSFDSLTRYILGKNLSKLDSIEKIYSWSEFQVIERSFNFAVRKHTDKIELIALQFYLSYETYFNTFVDDLDYEIMSAPHKVLVNGRYYVLKREKVKYDVGVALRYKNVFTFKSIIEEKNILLLGSYIEPDTKYMLNSTKGFDDVIFKNHPAVDISKFGQLPQNISVSEENIYKLFEKTKLVIGTASGTAVEAVACGISVIIIASQDNLTANPLVDYGKGKIWDIAFSQDDVELLYNKLIKYRKNNAQEIKKIASWYRDSFFMEPNEENIVKAFELKVNEIV